jgi:sulfur carrier protein
VTVIVNGEAVELPAGATVGWLVEACADGGRGVAVARNAEVVPRSAWVTTVLAGGDRVELLTAAQGG